MLIRAQEFTLSLKKISPFPRYRGLKLIISQSTYSYTADCYGENSSSAIAGQGFLRNMLGAVSPLFASQFFHNVGSQYAGLILSLVAGKSANPNLGVFGGEELMILQLC